MRSGHPCSQLLVAALLLLNFLQAACKTLKTEHTSALASDDQAAKDAREAFYRPDRIQRLEISMTHWDIFRSQEPNGGRCNFAFRGSRYDTYSADEVKLAGQTFHQIAIKKSSHCGSFSATKPSIKISFAKFDQGQGDQAQALVGTSELILKNSVQDPTFVRQCLGYELIRKAGSIAPHCGFIELIVNGQPAGLYINLEPSDKLFFERHWGAPAGNLYEVAGEELEPWAIDRFRSHVDSFRQPADKSAADISALIDAIKADQTADLSQVRQHLDIDQFIKFWALEILLVHWDGFSNNINNADIYFDGSGRARMLLSGIDQILTDYKDTRPPYSNVNKMIFINHALAAKLVRLPSFNAQLKQQIRWYLDHIWNEAEILSRANAITTLVSPYLEAPGGQNEATWSHERLIRVISERKRDLDQLLNTTADGQAAAASTPVCSSTAADPDGDGWGWENNRSCISPANAAPRCQQGAATDTDGDGWGWENDHSCQVRP